jgi:hypothetical protein
MVRADLKGVFPTYKMARDLAGSVFPVSEQVILQTARKHGIGRKMGRAVIFSVDDVNLMYEVLPCLSNSNVDPRRLIGSSAAPSAESELKKALELATEGSPKKSGRNAKPKSSHNQSTVVALPQRLRRLL